MTSVPEGGFLEQNPVVSFLETYRDQQSQSARNGSRAIAAFLIGAMPAAFVTGFINPTVNLPYTPDWANLTLTAVNGFIRYLAPCAIPLILGYSGREPVENDQQGKYGLVAGLAVTVLSIVSRV